MATAFVVGIVEGVWKMTADRRTGAAVHADPVVGDTGGGDVAGEVSGDLGGSSGGDGTGREGALRTLTELVRYAIEHPQAVLDLVGEVEGEADGPSRGQGPDRGRLLGRALPAAVLDIASAGTGPGSVADRSGARPPLAAVPAARLVRSDGGPEATGGRASAATASALDRVAAVAARTTRLSRLTTKLDAVTGTAGDDVPRAGGEPRTRRREHDGHPGELSAWAQRALEQLRPPASARTCCE